MRVFQFLTDYLQILNIFITIITILAAEVLILSGDYSRSILVWINVYFFVWLLYLVGAFLYKLDDREGNYRRNISYSFGMISICGIVARVVLFYFSDSSKLVQFFWFFTFNAISIHFYIPVQLSAQYYRLPYTRNSPTILVLISIIYVALLLSRFVAAGYPDFFNEILISQIYYSFFTASLIDFVINLMDGIEEYVEPPVEQQRVPVLPVRQRPGQAPRATLPDVVRVHRSQRQRRPRPECQICLLPYSEQVIPRILISCGHTVCQNCIGRIMGESNRVCCPVCRKVTVVCGSIEYLPRNYALLELTGCNNQANL